MKRSVLITGCSSGIGLAVAKGLSEDFHVIASARKLEDVKVLCNQGIDAVQLDISNMQSIEAGLDAFFKLTNGEIYGLFQNAGYAQIGALEDLPTNALVEQFQTNFFGWHHLTRLVLARMREKNQGRIIFNSSMFGLVATEFNGAYTATKHALEGYVDTLRHELRISQSNIYVSLLEPGPIESKIRANAIAPFKQYIDPQKSLYRPAYKIVLSNLEASHCKWKFTLAATRCIGPVKHALNSSRPKPRYAITVHTRIFSLLKRVLPTRFYDRAASAVAQYFYIIDPKK